MIWFFLPSFSPPGLLREKMKKKTCKGRVRVRERERERERIKIPGEKKSESSCQLSFPENLLFHSTYFSQAFFLQKFLLQKKSCFSLQIFLSPSFKYVETYLIEREREKRIERGRERERETNRKRKREKESERVKNLETEFEKSVPFPECSRKTYLTSLSLSWHFPSSREWVSLSFPKLRWEKGKGKRERGRVQESADEKKKKRRRNST